MKNIIDLSENNGSVNFNKVKQDGIDGVILRLGWIGNKENHTLDKRFIEFYNNAKSSGLEIGIYVYSYCKSITAIKSAVNWVLNCIIKYNLKFELPVFIDIEDNTILSCGKDNLTNQAIEFCDSIESKGFKSGIYASKSWFQNYLDINRLIIYKIWLAEWNGKNNHTANFKVDLWQYTSDGKVNRNKWACR